MAVPPERHVSLWLVSLARATAAILGVTGAVIYRAVRQDLPPPPARTVSRAWLFTLGAPDASLSALRIARQATGHSKVLVFRYCYHGPVD